MYFSMILLLWPLCSILHYKLPVKFTYTMLEAVGAIVLEWRERKSVSFSVVLDIAVALPHVRPLEGRRVKRKSPFDRC